MESQRQQGREIQKRPKYIGTSHHKPLAIGDTVLLGNTDIRIGIAPDTTLCGQVLIPNRELSGRTDQRVTHQAYPSLYLAWRAQHHALSHGGTLPDWAGEVDDLALYAESIGAYALYQLHGVGGHDPAEVAALQGLYAFIRDQLTYVRADPKVLAHTRMVRGGTVHDSRGRRNPPAAARALGASVQHLHTRMKDIRAIAPVLNRRALALWDLLHTCHRFFSDLWTALGRTDATEENRHERFFALLDAEPRADFRTSGTLLKVFADRLPSPYLLPHPFRRVAVKTEKLLVAARTAAGMPTEENAKTLRHLYGVLRRTLLPCHIQQRLEFQVLIPLSLILAERPREGAPGERLARIRERLRVLCADVEALSSRAMDSRVRAHVLRLLQGALSQAESAAWGRAKDLLKQASTVCGSAPK